MENKLQSDRVNLADKKMIYVEPKIFSKSIARFTHTGGAGNFEVGTSGTKS